MTEESAKKCRCGLNNNTGLQGLPSSPDGLRLMPNTLSSEVEWLDRKGDYNRV